MFADKFLIQDDFLEAEHIVELVFMRWWTVVEFMFFGKFEPALDRMIGIDV